MNKELNLTDEFKTAVGTFAALVESFQVKKYLDMFCGGVMPAEGSDRAILVRNSSKVEVKYGKCYARVDVGGSGRYMVDADGNIFGIKGYGVVHKGHQFGTLATANEYNWSERFSFRKVAL